MKIYTGTGDNGETGLYGGERVGKDDLRVEAYGTVDETSALLGVVVTLLEDPELREVVLELQRELFTVGADLATPLAREVAAGKSLVPRIEPAHSVALENQIDRFEAELEPLRAFIVPGGSKGSAALHQARAVARRAERHTVALWHHAPDTMNEHLLRYLNRLADLLFVLARAANHRAGVPDVPWDAPRVTLQTTKELSTMSERPTEGTPAPPFSLLTQKGETPVSLADYAGKQAVVLYFYPKDDTPGCTTESCNFRDMSPDYEASGAAILGISLDDVDSHKAFAEKFQLPFPLLADTDHEVAEAYGVYKEKNLYGKKSMGIERTTFVIDKNGVIAKVFPRVKVDQHGDEVLAFVRELNS